MLNQINKFQISLFIFPFHDLEHMQAIEHVDQDKCIQNINLQCFFKALFTVGFF
jgi:hypothetical protein